MHRPCHAEADPSMAKCAKTLFTNVLMKSPTSKLRFRQLNSEQTTIRVRCCMANGAHSSILQANPCVAKQSGEVTVRRGCRRLMFRPHHQIEDCVNLLRTCQVELKKFLWNWIIVMKTEFPANVDPAHAKIECSLRHWPTNHRGLASLDRFGHES